MAIARIRLRRGTASDWAAANPVLASGEPGVELDTGKQKVGDGVKAWADLPYTAIKGDPGPAGVADDASVKTLVEAPGSATRAALNATYLPKFKGNSAYALGDPIVSPTGELVTAKAAFTSGAVYDASNWNVPSAAAAAAFKRVVAGGTNTDGDNIRVGNFAYGPTTVGTTYVQGGSTNYENVIGGNTANVNTNTSNLTGAAALVAPDGNWSAILHGYDNVNNGWANVLTGFHCQMVAGSNHGVIAGGSDQKILGATTAYGTISGGTGHTVSASGGTVSGGTTNTASGTQSTVAGGLTNNASGAQAVIGGGQNNIASGSLSTVTGGNANQATGSNATVSGGTTNKAQNISAVVVGGSSNTASNQYSTVSGGLTNAANGVSSTVPGGRENTATGDYSMASGYKAVATQYGVRAHASGMFAAAGDAQVLDYVLRNTSTDATAKLLYPSGAAFLPAIPDSTLWGFEAMVVGRCEATGESAAYKITGAIDRGVGVATTALVGVPTVTVIAEDNAAWNVTVSAGAGDGTLRIFGIGEAAKSIRWVARLEITSVSG